MATKDFRNVNNFDNLLVEFKKYLQAIVGDIEDYQDGQSLDMVELQMLYEDAGDALDRTIAAMPEPIDIMK